VGREVFTWFGEGLLSMLQKDALGIGHGQVSSGRYSDFCKLKLNRGY